MIICFVLITKQRSEVPPGPVRNRTHNEHVGCLWGTQKNWGSFENEQSQGIWLESREFQIVIKSQKPGNAFKF